MIAIYGIDSTLAALGGFDFVSGNITISGLPLPYWIVSFPGGLLFGHFCPGERRLRLLYVFVVAVILLAIDLVMVWAGFLYYIKIT